MKWSGQANEKSRGAVAAREAVRDGRGGLWAATRRQALRRRSRSAIRVSAALQVAVAAAAPRSGVRATPPTGVKGGVGECVPGICWGYMLVGRVHRAADRTRGRPPRSRTRETSCRAATARLPRHASLPWRPWRSPSCVAQSLSRSSVSRGMLSSLNQRATTHVR